MVSLRLILFLDGYIGSSRLGELVDGGRQALVKAQEVAEEIRACPAILSHRNRDGAAPTEQA
ncbi:hypothetical protein U1Q18_026224, partial [Sarracenia purpurea var. burkii]